VPAPRKPNVSLNVTTLWDYPSQSYEGQEGHADFRGATPSHVIWNVVSRFSKEGETVLDPFCGSGTTLDVCKDTNRRGLGFDIAPARADIVKADARSIPLKQKSVDLVFFDPPYADNLTYSTDSRCLGKLKPDGRFQRAMRLVLDECARVLRDERMLAVYVCDVLDARRARFYPLGFEIFEMAKRHFVPVDVVCVVRHNKTLDMGNYRRAADEGSFYLRGFNYLLLLRKRDAREAATP
jgi:DNA modification methylase